MNDTTSIYVIGTPRGIKKVGLSATPEKRCAALNAAGLRDMSVLHHRTIPREISRRVEGHAHWLLRDVLERGEWFRVGTAEAIAAVDAAVLDAGTGQQARKHVGRRKEFPERITLPLAEGTTARLDALLEDGEDRVSLIRKAIEVEAKRRERAKSKD